MVVSVDLLYVFGRSFIVLSDELTLLVQFGRNHCGVIALSVWYQGGVFSNVIIIYRSLYSSDMCSCRACSFNR